MRLRFALTLALIAGCAQPDAPATLNSGHSPLCDDEDTLAALPMSEELDDGSWDGFTSYAGFAGTAPAYDTLEISEGQLTVEPNGGAWYQNGTSTFQFKELSGDFVVSTYVVAGRTGDASLPPLARYNLAGLMARAPEAAQSWVLIDVGSRANDSGVLARTTIAGQSQFTQAPGTHRGELRLCRVGSTYRMLHRLDGATAWTVMEDYYRPDLPETLQVGITAGAWQTPSDLTARFDYVRYAAVPSLDACTLPIDAASDEAPVEEPPAEEPPVEEPPVEEPPVEEPPEAVDPLAALDDEFDSAEALAEWTELHELQGTPVLYDQMSLEIVEGALVVDPGTEMWPGTGDGHGPGWFQDSEGTYLFKEVTGNFAVKTRVTVGTVADLNEAPQGAFNSAGFVLRDPASTVPEALLQNGNEAWLMYNVGRQAGFWATELKTTFPDDVGTSDSSLFLDPQEHEPAELIACRLGSTFRFFYRADSQTEWTETVPTAETLHFNGAGLPGEDYLAEGFDRPEFPETMQVGLLTNRWGTNGPAMRAAFDYVRFATPETVEDCVAAFE